MLSFIWKNIIKVVIINKDMLDNKNTERRPWSEQEDCALKSLYEGLKINKWSHIAQQLQMLGYTDRTGKQCRQRYNNHLDPSLSRDEWTFQEEKKLYLLHDQLGNKWAVISQRLSTGRTDNTIKNHFYSRLRKSLRRLNQIIQERYKKQLREIQTKVLYKIIQASEEKFKAEPMCEPELSDYSCTLKNKIIMFSYEEEQAEGREGFARELIEEIVEFNRNYKRKPKKFRKIGSSYQHIDQTEKMEIKKHYSCRFDFPQKEIEAPAVSFSSFSSKQISNREISAEENRDSDDINPVVKVETQKQKMISPIILTSHQAMLDQRPQKQEKIQNSQQILQALGLLQDDLSMPHPIFLKKNTSWMSSESQDAQQFKFFDDSSAEMKLMATPIPSAVKKESMEDRLFH